jgi:hypothetical protein
MLLGTLNQHMISLMNSTTLADIIEVAGFTSTHFVNLSTAMKLCVNPPFSFLEWTYQIHPHVEKGQMISMVWS